MCLKGTSGLIPGFGHIAAPYDSNGLAFVVWNFRKPYPHIGWKRMTAARAKREGREVIKCFWCRRPAAILDHYWPYEIDQCLCEKHRKGALHDTRRND